MKPNQEIVGFLSGVSQSEYNLLLKFTFEQEIQLPLDSFDTALLNLMLGKKIGILNHNNGTFKIRIIKK